MEISLGSKISCASGRSSQPGAEFRNSHLCHVELNLLFSFFPTSLGIKPGLSFEGIIDGTWSSQSVETEVLSISLSYEVIYTVFQGPGQK